MVTKEEIERYYAEKLGKDYENDMYAVPNYIITYFKTCGLDEDENGLYWAVYDCFADTERQYATMDQILEDIRQKLDVDILILQKLKTC